MRVPAYCATHLPYSSEAYRRKEEQLLLSLEDYYLQTAKEMKFCTALSLLIQILEMLGGGGGGGIH